jgi:hypothetical protein
MSADLHLALQASGFLDAFERPVRVSVTRMKGQRRSPTGGRGGIGIPRRVSLNPKATSNLHALISISIDHPISSFFLPLLSYLPPVDYRYIIL